MRVGIINYGTGNIKSIASALTELHPNLKVVYSNKPSDFRTIDAMILPGVGHFGSAYGELVSSGLKEVLTTKVFSERLPVLGICLGMQLMGTWSEEGDSEGLGWLPYEVIQIRPKNKSVFKVPNISWGQVKFDSSGCLLNYLKKDEAIFYFCHSYAIKATGNEIETSTFFYEDCYVSSIESGCIFGVQFHPEKSKIQGRIILNNFIEFVGLK